MIGDLKDKIYVIRSILLQNVISVNWELKSLKSELEVFLAVYINLQLGSNDMDVMGAGSYSQSSFMLQKQIINQCSLDKYENKLEFQL